MTFLQPQEVPAMQSNLAMVAIALASVTLATSSSEGAPMKSKLKGDAYYFHLGEVYDSHAYDHARILHRYEVDGEPVPMEVIEEQTAQIRNNIEGANKAYARLSEAARKDPVTAKRLAEIEQFHEGILKLCQKLDTDAQNTARKIKEALTAAYSSSRQAAASQDILTEELDKPGHGAFSD
jgi:hypothetical protein